MVATIYVLFALSVIIVIVSLIMAPESNSFSGAIVGSSDLDLFKVSKERGTKKFLKWTMFSLGILLLILSVVARIFM